MAGRVFDRQHQIRNILVSNLAVSFYIDQLRIDAQKDQWKPRSRDVQARGKDIRLVQSRQVRLPHA
jgi:hypothetical protein